MLRFAVLTVAIAALPACEWDWRRFESVSQPRLDSAVDATVDATVDGGPAVNPAPWGPTGKFDLVFREDCDGTRIDGTRWHTQYFKRRMPFAFYDWSGSAVDDKNVLVGDGVCRLLIERRSIRGMSYASGVMDSDGKFEMTHGHVEVRMRAARGMGIRSTVVLHHPTLWPPQIDVIRIPGGSPTTWNHGLWTNGSNGDEYDTARRTGEDMAADFHVFGVTWTPEGLDYWVDGQKSWSAPPGSFSRLKGPVKIEITAHVAGTGEQPDATTVFPAYVTIDWVRGWLLR